MPAHSEHQQQAAAVALSAKRGKLPRKKLGGAAQSMMGMKEESLRHFASTPTKHLPKMVGER